MHRLHTLGLWIALGAIYDAPVLAADKNPCREAWEQNEQNLPANEKLGNPYAIAKGLENDWRFAVKREDHTILVVPKEFVQFQVETDDAPIDCQVPIAWKALDTSLGVSVNPLFANAQKITMINNQPFGYRSSGGIYVRYALIPGNTSDVNLAWFMQSAPRPGLDQDIRHQLGLPDEQPLTVAPAAEYLANPNALNFQAVSFTVGAEPIKFWAVPLANSKQLWPQLQFLPFGTPANGATIEAAWAASKILDLSVMKLWDKDQQRLAPCANVTTPGLTLCRQIVDETFNSSINSARLGQQDLCVHLAWNAPDFAQALVSTFCVDLAAGHLRFAGTRYSQQRADFGLPNASW